eukprot:COSAG06_NODE_54240_length_295_cov_1.505102_1_plen_74_part_10
MDLKRGSAGVMAMASASGARASQPLRRIPGRGARPRRLLQLPSTDAPSAASGCPGTPHDRSNTSWTIQTTPATS